MYKRGRGSCKREWVRAFQVDSPVKNEKGHTIYTVTSILFPVGFPEASTKIVVTKRFSDFQKLHAKLSQIHRSLHLKGEFPPALPKTSSRFPSLKKESAATIQEERKQKSLELLEFAAEVPQLQNSEVFLSFFTNMDESDRESMTMNSPVYDESSVLDDDCPSVDVTPTLTPEQSAEAEITLAEKSEADGDLTSSITHYRNAIGKLLKLVPEAKDQTESKGLKKRISKLISKAESLVKERDSKSSEIKIKVVAPKKSLKKIPHLDLFGDLRDLKRYKIIKVLENKVLLARDSYKSDEEVIIKSLQKSAMVFKKTKTSLLPINIPYMVQLICYYETDNTIFLVLEYISHGRLYDNVKGKTFVDVERLKRDESPLGDDEASEEEEDIDNDITTVSIKGKKDLICVDNDGIHRIKDDDDDDDEDDKGDLVSVEEARECQEDSEDKEEIAQITQKEKRLMTDPLRKFRIDENSLSADLLRRWSAQLCHVLFGLHSRNIIIKDLNPDNLLLDSKGDLKLSYQCEWVSVDRPLSEKAISKFYSAPEVTNIEPVTPSCDYWSVGVILYELATGKSFAEIHPTGLLVHTPLEFPEEPPQQPIDPVLKDFIRSLLQPLPHQRLGAGTDGQNSVKAHGLFSGIEDWDNLQKL